MMVIVPLLITVVITKRILMWMIMNIILMITITDYT